MSGEWHRLGVGTWARVRRETRRRDALSAMAANTHRWNLRHNLMGVAGEAFFSQVCGHPWNEGGPILDGGTDFPGVDVKASRHLHAPTLVKAPGSVKAPVYALVAFDLDHKRGRLVGYATRRMLAEAPVTENSYGPVHTLSEAELLSADEVLVRLFVEREQRRLRAAG
jgi:hypothetical protein